MTLCYDPGFGFSSVDGWTNTYYAVQWDNWVKCRIETSKTCRLPVVTFFKFISPLSWPPSMSSEFLTSQPSDSLIYLFFFIQKHEVHNLTWDVVCCIRRHSRRQIQHKPLHRTFPDSNNLSLSTLIVMALKLGFRRIHLKLKKWELLNFYLVSCANFPEHFFNRSVFIILGEHLNISIILSTRLLGRECLHGAGFFAAPVV